jgi:hypothetical protein
VDLSLPSKRVIRSLKNIIQWRGKPDANRRDNGPENISQNIQTWAKGWGIELQHIQPGKPSKMPILKDSTKLCATSGWAHTSGRALNRCRNMPRAGCTSTITNAPTWPLVACPRSSIWSALRNPSTFVCDGYWGGITLGLGIEAEPQQLASKASALVTCPP